MEKINKGEEGIVARVVELEVDSRKTGHLSRAVDVILTRLESGAWLFRSIAPQPFKHSKSMGRNW